MAKKRADAVNLSNMLAVVSVLVLVLVLGASVVAAAVMKGFPANVLPHPRRPAVSQSDGRLSPSDTEKPEGITVTAEATIAATGDVIGHDAILRTAYNSKTKKYSFEDIFPYVKPYVSASDYAVANLETTLRGTEGGAKYQGFPLFNTPDSMVDAVKNAGFDMLLTSNNHCYDTGSKGMHRTVEMLDKKNMDHTGTRLKEQDKPYLVKDIGGIKVGMLCYTYETTPQNSTKKTLNGLPVKGNDPALVNSFRYDKLDDFYKELTERMTAMKGEGAEAFVMFIHWGTEYKTSPNAQQKKIAQALCDLGIDVIVGGHPHVIQPVTLLTGSDGEHRTLCLYSAGNAVSNQRTGTANVKTGHTEDGCLFRVTFRKYSDGRVILADADLLPTWVNLTTDASKKKVYRVIPLDVSVTDWQKAFGMTAKEAASAKASYKRTTEITGEGMTQAQTFLRDRAEQILKEGGAS